MAPWAAYILQMVAAGLMAWLGVALSAKKPAIWGTALGLGMLGMAAWPLMRAWPTLAIEILGAKGAACVEITGLLVPTTLVFSIAAMHVTRKSDRRAVIALMCVAGVFFAISGRWMIHHALPKFGPTDMRDGVCRQSTNYSCVAASLVTMLRARGVRAEEEEMCRLAYVQVNAGATDSRALWALETKLEGTEWQARYESMTFDELGRAPMPALVQLGFSFFASHMVPVLEVTPSGVTVGDPLEGERSMSRREFESRWKGQAIVMQIQSVEQLNRANDGQ